MAPISQGEKRKCIVCECPGASVELGVVHDRWECWRCGKFGLTPEATAKLPERLSEAPLRRSLLSYAIRRMQSSDETRAPALSDATIESILANERLPSPPEQADQLVLWIGDNQQGAQGGARSQGLELDARIGSLISGLPQAFDGLLWLYQQPEQRELFSVMDGELGGLIFQLSFAGWEKYAELRQKRADSKVAFIALKFGEPEVETAVNNCFRPAVRRAGFGLRVLTEPQPAGLIDDQIRSGILGARFVIADLTDGSRGSYWEAGFAEGVGLPVIYACKKSIWDDEKTHFDTNHMNTILWDPDHWKESEERLVDIIRATPSLRADAKQADD